MRSNARVLIVEDQFLVANNLELILKRAGFRVCTIARSAMTAMKVIERECPDLVILNILLEGKLTGIDLAKVLSQKDIAFIYLSADSKQTILDAALMTRPYGFLVKPFRERDLIAMLEIALYFHQKNLELVRHGILATTPSNVANDDRMAEMIGQSSAMQELQKNITRVARSDIAVLITGESGTGKELIARNIHRLSPRRSFPLVTVNCAALPASLIESELFGHEKGAFTGAIDRHIGRFEQAQGGTIFLDEISELPLETQAKFLRVLQEKEVEVIGGKTKRIDIRVIAATNRNLQEEMEAGKFRADLYYRLNVFPLISPPLRDRKEDIPLLIDHLIRKIGKNERRNVTGIDEQSVEELQAYNWPGNVRELENMIYRGILLSNGPNLTTLYFHSDQVKGEAVADGRSMTIAEVEKAHISKVLAMCNWKIFGPRGAAGILGMKVPTLNSRIKKLGICKNGLKKNSEPHKQQNG